MNIITIEPEALRAKEAAKFVGVSPQVLDCCRRAGWIRPLICSHRITSYRPSADCHIYSVTLGQLLALAHPHWGFK